MTEAAWLRVVPRIRSGLTEVYCHPAVAPALLADELAALMSPLVREALDRAGIHRTSFAAAANRH
jgi:hypothetical protein